MLISGQIPKVDLVVNVFERTYRDALKPGWFAGIKSSNLFEFSKTTLLINNVNDKEDAQSRATKLLHIGEIDEVVFVDSEIKAALQRVGLTQADLGSVPHFSDCAFVAICNEGSPWMLYWDAEVAFKTPYNWITPAIAMIERDHRFMVANPDWAEGDAGALSEMREKVDNFAIGYGFSDQVFLCRRSDFQQPIYNFFCPISLRYPLAHISSVFEERVDSYMRRRGRLRATCLSARYAHPKIMGASYPSTSIAQKIKRTRNKFLLRLMSTLKSTHPCLSP